MKIFRIATTIFTFISTLALLGVSILGIINGFIGLAIVGLIMTGCLGYLCAIDYKLLRATK